jgi:bifunctional ADP-heptose synthase (sugar kinase/adenylyltransferase)
MTAHVVSFAELCALTREMTAAGQKVVHVHGGFSMIGRQELARLEAARALGSTLVVTIDASHRPALIDPAIRAQAIAGLPIVAAVAIVDGMAAAACASDVGATLFRDGDSEPEPAVLDATQQTELVRRARDTFTPEAERFIREFRKRYSTSDVIRALESLRNMRVLVVGDTIIDEYHFVRPYGMPLKAPIIASQFLESEAYLGGILAVANHIGGFCDRVDLVTALGSTDSREPFIRAGLLQNVTPTFFHRPGAPTTTKRRYLRRFLLQKLFEVSFFDDRPLPEEVDAQLAAHLRNVASQYDAVVVADFGHGCLSDKSIAALAENAKFLAVNTQLNSVNHGYHVITKYPRADYVCIDEEETRMACRDRLTSIETLLPGLAETLDAKTVTVTRGHHGSTTWNRGGAMATIPILSRQVIDTIGAGDAYLSITAPCVAAGFSPELVGFIGNAVGALAVRIVGNKTSVAPEGLFEFIHVLMGDA